MTSFATFLIFFMSMFAPEHNVPLAVFHLHQVGEEIKLDINIDAASVANEIGIGVEQLSLTNLSNYLNAQTVWSFDDQTYPLSIRAFHFQDDHINVNAFFEEEICAVEEIEVKNLCLINERNHSNIIQLDIKEKSSDFRMHRGRTTIKIDL